MQTFEVRIEGITALLQHRFTEASEAAKSTRRVQLKEEDPRAVAERAAYRMPDGTLYLPGAAISRLLREAGGGHKQRGSRKSLKYVIPAAVIVPDEAIPLINGDGRSAATEFEVDSRPVTIPATKGRIMRHRPRLNVWAAEFSLEIDEDVLPPEVIHELLSEGGNKIGVGDFRPERGGPFGRFHVTRWEKLGAADAMKVAAE